MAKYLLCLFLLVLPFSAFAQPAVSATCRVQGGTLSVDQCGADKSGRTDSTAAFAAAVSAIPSGGTLYIPGGTYALSGTIAITKSINISCTATIRPFREPALLTSFFSITVGGVSFDGNNKTCVFDGISAAYNNFSSAITAAGPNDYITAVKVTGVHIKNLALGLANGPYEAISMTAVKNCTISNNLIENSGPNKLYVGGFAIYLQYTQDCEVSGNTGDHLGGTFINESAGLHDTFSTNHASYVTLFAYKAGYGNGITVTNAGRPGQNAFTVADSNLARSALAQGKFINILDKTGDLEGTVRNWVVGNGFLTVFMTAPMSGAPAVGDSVEPLSTSLKYDSNSCTQTGDNCFDINGWHDIENTNTNCRFVGEYQPTGKTFGGLATCIWQGYDPQDTTSTYRGSISKITGTDADHVGGVAIMVTEGVSNVVVENYKLSNINELNKAGGAGCGIALNLFNTNPNSRGSDLHIGRGTVTGITPNACMAWIENSLNDTIIGLTGTATNGVVVDAGGGDVLRDNTVTATGTADGTYAYLIGPGGGQHEIGVVFRNNRGVLTASSWGSGHGYGFLNQSSSNSGVDIDGTNMVTAPAAASGRFVARSGIGAR